MTRAALPLLAAAAAALDCPKDQYTALNLPKGKNNLVHTTRILHPNTPGMYNVFVFLHGFAMDVESYDQILCEAAANNIVILPQMAFKALNTSLAGDAVLLTPYLHDATQGILPRIGDSILSGYTVGQTVGWGGHSRGGGVLTHAYSNGILPDTYAAVLFLDPVVSQPAKDCPEVRTLSHTRVRALILDDDSICVTNGWNDTIGANIQGSDRQVEFAMDCKHMDVVSSWGHVVPFCQSKHTDSCRRRARDAIAAAGWPTAQ